MLRYDALGTGWAALVAMNLGTRGKVELDLSGLPPQLIGKRPTNLMCLGCPQGPPLANRTAMEMGNYRVGNRKIPRFCRIFKNRRIPP